MIKEIKNSLIELGLSDNEIKIYVALTQLGESPASKVAKKADLPRTTAISILDKLALENYLSVHRYKGVNYYEIESPQLLQKKFETRVGVAKQLETILTDMYRSEAKFPFARVYDTKRAVKNFIEKTLLDLPKSSIIYTIDSPLQGHYRKILGEDTNNIMFHLKKKRDLITKTLIPHGMFREIDPVKWKSQNIILKELPEGIDFDASIWFVENLVVFFSGNPPFATAIQHKQIFDSLFSIYDHLWSVSNLKYQPGRG